MKIITLVNFEIKDKKQNNLLKYFLVIYLKFIDFFYFMKIIFKKGIYGLVKANNSNTKKKKYQIPHVKKVYILSHNWSYIIIYKYIYIYKFILKSRFYFALV